MRVAVYRNNQDVRLEERPRPEIRAGEILVRIEASGICGSDVMEWYRVPKAPIVLGHEVAGVVEEVGAGVDRFAGGDRVMATHHVPCNTCRYCLTDRQNVCETLHSTHFDPGGFCEYVRLPALNVDRGTFRLPDGVSSEEGTFIEPLACVVRSQRVARIRPGQSLAVLGSGVSGILQILTARALGAGRIFATDVHPFRRQAAWRFGADGVFPAEEDVPSRIREANGGHLADLVVVCTAALPAFAQAFRCVDRGGTIVFYAPVPPGVTFPVPMNDLWRDGVTVVHSYAGPPAEIATAIDLIAAKRVEVGPLVTHRLSLAETGRGFTLVAQATDSLKVIIDPRR